MDFIKSAIKALPIVASSPLALIAFLCLVGAWVVIGLRVQRNKNLLANLEKLPSKDRLQALKDEMGTVRIKSGLTPEQYLRSRIHRFWLIGFVTLCLVILLTLALAASRARTTVDTGSRFSGVLDANSRTLLSADAKIQIGDSSTVLQYRNLSNRPIFKFFGDNILSMRLENGQLKVSSLVRNPHGEVVAELIDNEWKINPQKVFDKNYTKDALEVRDQDGDVVLQIKLIEDRIHLQFKAYDSNGGAVVLANNPNGPDAILSTQPEEVRNLHITPIFRYPSDLHLGELR